MDTPTELNEYLDEIRKRVCSHCVERPPGGPPCDVLGKVCGVELHLPKIIEAVHTVDREADEPSRSILPYLVCNRASICARCAYLGSEHCPCPMDYLAVLLVEAVEAVDGRRAVRETVVAME
jgi:hypothetical protein